MFLKQKIKIEYIYHPDFVSRHKPFIDYDLSKDPDAFEPYQAKAIQSGRLSRLSRLSAYIDSISEYRVLTRQAEYNIFMKYNYIKYQISKLLNKLRDRSPLRKLKEIEHEIEEMIKIRNILINHNLRLVVSVLGKCIVTNEKPLDDLVSDGNVWLIYAIDKFDVSYGYKFSTYLTRAIRLNSWRQHKYFSTIVMASDVDLDRIPDHRNQFEEFEMVDSSNGLYEYVKNELKERESLIIAKRFGLNGHSQETLHAIGKKHGISKERVRQIEAVAIEKLRKIDLPYFA